MSEQKVDITTLSLHQLSEIRKSLEAEIDHLSQSGGELRNVMAKYIECSQSVKTASAKATGGADIMVPLTSSLYVPGKMSENKTYIVDVGTNYYVEKTAEETIKFFDNKVETLNKNLVDLGKLLDDKVTTLRNMDMIYKEKFRQELAKTEKQGDKR